MNVALSASCATDRTDWVEEWRKQLVARQHNVHITNPTERWKSFIAIDEADVVVALLSDLLVSDAGAREVHYALGYESPVRVPKPVYLVRGPGYRDYGWRAFMRSEGELPLDPEAGVAALDTHWQARTSGEPSLSMLRDGLTRVARRTSAMVDANTGLILVDIADFKRVNLDYSHEGGDRVLANVGRRLRSLGPNLVPYRVGGDQFAVVTDLRAGDDVGSIAAVLRTTIEKPVAFGAGHIEVRAWVAAARTVRSRSFVELYAIAEGALTAARQNRSREIVIAPPDAMPETRYQRPVRR